MYFQATFQLHHHFDGYPPPPPKGIIKIIICVWTPHPPPNVICARSLTVVLSQTSYQHIGKHHKKNSVSDNLMIE